MKTLQKLALQHVIELVEQSGEELSEVAYTLIHEKDKFDLEKNLYPAGAKLRDISKWINAVLEDE